MFPKEFDELIDELPHVGARQLLLPRGTGWCFCRGRHGSFFVPQCQGFDAVAHVKFFTPWSNWTWYASEYDPGKRLFFGVVVGHEREFGYFCLDELERVTGPGGLRIERDLYWTPRPLDECF